MIVKGKYGKRLTAFSDNPDYDCCISEFHPFSF